MVNVEPLHGNMSGSTADVFGSSAPFFQSRCNGNELVARQAAEIFAQLKRRCEHQSAMHLMEEFSIDFPMAMDIVRDPDPQKTCRLVYATDEKTSAPLPRAPQGGVPCKGTGSMIPDEVDTVTTEDSLDCPIPLCKRKGPPFKRRRGLGEHFCLKHNMSPAEARIEADKAFSRSSEQTHSSGRKTTPIDCDDPTIQQVRNIVGHVPHPEQFMVNAAGVGGQFANVPFLPSGNINFDTSLNMATHLQQGYGADIILAQQAYADGQAAIGYRERLYANTRSYLQPGQGMAPLQRISEHMDGPSYNPEWSNTSSGAMASQAQSPPFHLDNMNDTTQPWGSTEYLEGQLWNQPDINDSCEMS